MKNYQLELRQIVDFPRCRIYPRHLHDCSHRYGRSRTADDEFLPQRPNRR